MLQEKFQKAAEEINKALKTGGLGGAKLEDLAKNDVYVRALKEEQEMIEQMEDTKIMKGEADSEASAAYVELAASGVSTPSESFIIASKRKADFMNKYDEPGRGMIGATSLAHVAGIGRPLDTRELKSAFSIMDNVVEQGNFDDLIGAMGQQAQMLVDGQIDESTSQGKKQADDIKR